MSPPILVGGLDVSVVVVVVMPLRVAELAAAEVVVMRRVRSMVDGCQAGGLCRLAL
jgi:hypothetical protein